MGRVIVIPASGKCLTQVLCNIRYMRPHYIQFGPALLWKLWATQICPLWQPRPLHSSCSTWILSLPLWKGILDQLLGWLYESDLGSPILTCCSEAGGGLLMVRGYIPLTLNNAPACPMWISFTEPFRAHSVPEDGVLSLCPHMAAPSLCLARPHLPTPGITPLRSNMSTR